MTYPFKLEQQNKFAEMIDKGEIDYQWVFDMGIKMKDYLREKYGSLDKTKLFYLLTENLGTMIMMTDTQMRANGTPDHEYFAALAHLLYFAQFVKSSKTTWSQREGKNE